MRIPETIKKNWVALAIALVYLVIDLIFTSQEIYIFNLFPAVLLLVYIALSRIDILFFIIVFFTPVSVGLIAYLPSSPVDFYIPTEPILFGTLVLLIYRMLKTGYVDKRVVNHPVTYAILFNLLWMFITSITSSMPLVSFKYLLARVWFLATFYFLAIHVFRKTSNIATFIWCYAVPMMGVVAYSITRHLEFGLFDKMAAHTVMSPFFRDHTSYGAILAMLFFAYAGIIFRHGSNFVIRAIHWVGFAIITAGLVLSYTRAAWLSVLAGFGILTVTLLRIKFKYLALVGILVVGYFFSQRVEIMHRLEQNRQDSSADLAEHVQSMSNITTDDSNLERLNRWTAAFRMFKERPVFGWGPGTYMFKYAPFQLASKKTLISTNFGDRGNTHSEYIGPLSESGVLGSLSFVLIVIVALVTGFRVYRNVDDPRLKRIVLAFILGFCTYLIHGVLNNFLDTDKASALFWGFIAVFVSLDIYHKPMAENIPEKAE